MIDTGNNNMKSFIFIFPDTTDTTDITDTTDNTDTTDTTDVTVAI